MTDTTISTANIVKQWDSNSLANMSVPIVSNVTWVLPRTQSSNLNRT